MVYFSQSHPQAAVTRRALLAAAAAAPAAAAVPGIASAATGSGDDYPGVSHRHVQVNNLRFRVAEAGKGPLVLLLHGFPQTSYVWRRQLVALARAGFHAVAPDQRGYPGSDAPPSVLDYSLQHLAGDAVGMINALGAKDAVVVGHDYGAPVAQGVALNRPDLVRGVAVLSFPLQPRGEGLPLDELRERFGDDFYQLYMQKPGVAEREFERRTGDVLRKLFYWYSGDAPTVGRLTVDDRGLTGSMPLPKRLPPWLSERDVAIYTRAFSRRGFTAPINWYRNINRNWGLNGSWAGARITRPAMFLGADRDPVAHLFGLETLHRLNALMATDLRSSTVLAGAGHWIPEERPRETSAALVEFASSVS